MVRFVPGPARDVRVPYQHGRLHAPAGLTFRVLGEFHVAIHWGFRPAYRLALGVLRMFRFERGERGDLCQSERHGHPERSPPGLWPRQCRSDLTERMGVLETVLLEYLDEQNNGFHHYF